MPKSLIVCIFSYVIPIITKLIIMITLRIDGVREGYSSCGTVVRYSLWEDYPLWIRILLPPLMLFTVFCVFPALISVIIGIQELRTRETKVLSSISVTGGVVLIILYFIALGQLSQY